MLAILLILVSPFVGSFLALLADRLPAGQDAVFARSACASCARPLRAFELIPLVSFLIQSGKCRSCGAAIPAHLPAAEIAASFAAITVVWLTDDPMVMLLGAMWLWCLITLFLTDALVMRLPDPLTLALLLIAASLAVVQGDFPIAVLGAAIGAGSFWLIRMVYFRLRGIEGLGLGDVKLMAGIGAALGPMLLAHVVLLAGIGGIAYALLTGQTKRHTALPFGSFLAAAAAIVWIITQASVKS